MALGDFRALPATSWARLYTDFANHESSVSCSWARLYTDLTNKESSISCTWARLCTDLTEKECIEHGVSCTWARLCTDLTEKECIEHGFSCTWARLCTDLANKQCMKESGVSCGMAGIGMVGTGDFRAMPVNAWAQIYSDFAGDGGLKRGSFQVPDDPCRTPQGPKITSAKCLGFLADETPGNACDDELHEEKDTDVNRNCFEFDIGSVSDEETSKSAGLAGHTAWKKFSAARGSVSEQASKAKKQVQKSIGYMKEQSESVLRMPVQMQKYALEKAETAREKAQAVSAAVTARVSQSAQKGFDMAKSMRAPQTKTQHGGA